MLVLGKAPKNIAMITNRGNRVLCLHHLMIAAISPFPFVLFSLLQFRWLTGTVSGVLSAFWYLSILFYLFVAVFIAATWFKDLF